MKTCAKCEQDLFDSVEQCYCGSKDFNKYEYVWSKK